MLLGNHVARGVEERVSLCFCKDVLAGEDPSPTANDLKSGPRDPSSYRTDSP